MKHLRPIHNIACQVHAQLIVSYLKNDLKLRTDELLLYLQQHKSPNYVLLSEDATKINEVIQYDLHSNKLVGILLPINERTGLPITMGNKATSTAAIDVLCFASDSDPKYNSIMRKV